MSHHTSDTASSTADSSSVPPTALPASDAPIDVRTFHLYSLLGVARTADRDEIKRVFRQAVRLHPDLPGGHEEQFKAIVLAGEILRDETKRAEYDQLGDAGIHQIQAMFMSEHDSDPLPDTSSSESTIHNAEEEEEGEEKKDNKETYQKKKKNKKQAAAAAAAAGAASAPDETVKRKAKAPPPIYITAHVSIEDMIRGSVDVAFYRHISNNAATPSEPMADKTKKKKKTPPKRTRVAANATIDLPDGYMTNPAITVKLAGAGHFDMDTGKTGSVIVAFAAKPHQWVTRSGFDLISTAAIRPIDMVLRRDFFVPYINNQWIRVNAGTLPSFRLCFSHLGLPNGNSQGNLYVDLKVVLHSEPLDATASRVLAAVFDVAASWSPAPAAIIDVPHDHVG